MRESKNSSQFTLLGEGGGERKKKKTFEEVSKPP